MWYHTVFIFLWFISLSIMPSKSIHVATNGKISFFLWLNGTPLQYSCLENPMDGGAWWAAVHGVTKSRTEWLHFHFSLACIGEGNGNPLQCSCLENPRDGGAWWAAVCGVAQSRTRLKQLSSSSSSILLPKITLSHSEGYFFFQYFSSSLLFLY